jgi:hypothetical protein
MKRFSHWIIDHISNKSRWEGNLLVPTRCWKWIWILIEFGFSSSRLNSLAFSKERGEITAHKRCFQYPINNPITFPVHARPANEKRKVSRLHSNNSATNNIETAFRRNWKLWVFHVTFDLLFQSPQRTRKTENWNFFIVRSWMRQFCAANRCRVTVLHQMELNGNVKQLRDDEWDCGGSWKGRVEVRGGRGIEAWRGRFEATTWKLVNEFELEGSSGRSRWSRFEVEEKSRLKLR